MRSEPVVGTGLRRFAERTLHPITVDRVVLPALADLQHECASATTSLYTRARGYIAVLKTLAVCVAGDAVRDRDRHAASLLVRLLACLTLLVVLMTLPPAVSMARVLSHFGASQGLTALLLLIPSSIPVAIPCALFLALALHRCSDAEPFGRLLPVAVVCVLACMALMVAMVSTLVPVGNQTSREFVFSKLQSDGYNATLEPGLSEMTWTALNDRIRNPPSVRAEEQARAHRQGRVAMVMAVLVLAPLGLALAGRWRSRALTAVAATVLLVLYTFCFTHGWNAGGRPLTLWAWSTNVAFFVLGVGLVHSRAEWSREHRV